MTIVATPSTSSTSQGHIRASTPNKPRNSDSSESLQYSLGQLGKCGSEESILPQLQSSSTDISKPERVINSRKSAQRNQSQQNENFVSLKETKRSGSSSDLNGQQNAAIQRVVSYRKAQQKKESQAEQEAAKKLEEVRLQRKKEEESKLRRRAQIYAINAVMRKQQKEKIAWFIQERKLTLADEQCDSD